MPPRCNLWKITQSYSQPHIVITRKVITLRIEKIFRIVNGKRSDKETSQLQANDNTLELATTPLTNAAKYKQKETQYTHINLQQ